MYLPERNKPRRWDLARLEGRVRKLRGFPPPRCWIDGTTGQGSLHRQAGVVLEPASTNRSCLLADESYQTLPKALTSYREIRQPLSPTCSV